MQIGREIGSVNESIRELPDAGHNVAIDRQALVADDPRQCAESLGWFSVRDEVHDFFALLSCEYVT